MVKIVPAGSNVNLDLDDPYDKLLRTIQTASQVQGLVNQSQLQKEKRNAIKIQSLETSIANSVNNIDKSNFSSLLSGEESLKKLRDNFVSENPNLIDRADTIYNTTLSTMINPVKKTHRDFGITRDNIENTLSKLDEHILSINGDGSVVFKGDENLFKDDYQKLSTYINRYETNMRNYNEVMPDDNIDLFDSVSRAKTVMNQLPQMMLGVFDETEQKIYSDFINGGSTEAVFKNSLKNYYNQTAGRVKNYVMPALRREMKNKYENEYLPLNSIVSNIKNDTLPRLSVNPELANKDNATYIDDLDDEKSPKYFLNGVEVGDFNNKDALLRQYQDQLEDIQFEIENKDASYRGYNLEQTGEAFSYAQELNSDGQWIWEPGAKGEINPFLNEVQNAKLNAKSDDKKKPAPDDGKKDNNVLFIFNEQKNIQESKYPKQAEKQLKKLIELQNKQNAVKYSNLKGTKDISNFINQNIQPGQITKEQFETFKEKYDNLQIQFDDINKEQKEIQVDAFELNVTGRGTDVPPKGTEFGERWYQLDERKRIIKSQLDLLRVPYNVISKNFKYIDDKVEKEKEKYNKIILRK